MVLEIARLVLGYRPAAHRHARFVRRFRIAGEERVPFRQRLVFGTEAIGAGRGQPGEALDIGGAEADAIGYERAAVAIIGAARGAAIERGERPLPDRRL